MDTVKINTLSEVIEFLNDSKVDEFVFRGEDKKYPSVTSSAFRKKSNKKLDMGRSRYVNSMLKSYYREIAYSLNNDERNNFICYAQHHGLPTNLIDVTENISTALYFASLGNRNEIGYVYAFKTKNKFKLSTDILGGNQILHIFDVFSYNFVNAEYRQELFDMQKYEELTFEMFYELKRIIIENREEIVESFIEGFQIIQGGKFTEEQFTKIYEPVLEMLHLKKDSFNISSDILRIIKRRNNTQNEWFINKLNENKEKLSLTHKNDVATNDTVVLWTLYDICYTMFWSNRTDKQISIPHVLYYPDVIFERMERQSGLFIYQNYPLNSARGDSVENIQHDYVMEIHDKERIINELARVGITKKTLFPDHDNVASDIKSKFGF
ncbi:FRG domain-containing protein [Aerococcus urinaeequi]|uniref:FRG domain-containing protein n=1 Tax=Aerococcus urinaeequi TaxID=51665 RepID=UPI003EC72D22